MNSKFLLVPFVIFINGTIIAFEKTQCKSGSIERSVEIVFEDSTKKVPCQVKYTKEGGVEKILYSAQNKEGYCEEKAVEFVGKLTESGFSCHQLDLSSTPASNP